MTGINTWRFELWALSSGSSLERGEVAEKPELDESFVSHIWRNVTCLAAKLSEGGLDSVTHLCGFSSTALNFLLLIFKLFNSMNTFILPVWTTPSGEGSPSPDHMEKDEGHPDEAFWLVTSTEFPQRGLLGLKRACHLV